MYNIKEKETSKEKMENEWNNWNLNHGWPLTGYYKSDEGRNEIESCEKCEEDNIIAIGDNKGFVKIYKYPILNEEQEFRKSEECHAKHVKKLKFGINNIIFSTGVDGCLYKWEISEN